MVNLGTAEEVNAILVHIWVNETNNVIAVD